MTRDIDETPRTSCEVPSSSFPEKFPPKSSAPSVLEMSQSPTLVDIADRAPDGGLRAWLVVLGSFLIHCFCFAPTDTTYFAGFVSGVAADKFGYRITALLGTAIMAIALILASFASQVWHLYLSQGFLFGFGASLVYYPGIGAPSHWFDAKRGLALGLAVSGTGLGGLALSPATQALMDSVGVGWTLRALALFCVVVCGTASFLIVERESGKKAKEPVAAITDVEIGAISEKLASAVPEQKPTGLAVVKSFFAELKVFKDPQFLSLTFAEIAASIGFLIPMYYFQTYSLHIGLTAQNGALIAGISSGASVCAWMTAGSILIVWTLSKSFGVYLVFAIIYGFFAGGYVSLVPLVVSETFGSHQLSTVIGFMYACSGVGMLSGAPIAGMILDSTLPNINYLPVIMTAGGTLLLGAICVTAWVYFRRQDKKTKRDVVVTPSTVSTAPASHY
ncbi:hypothetical protein BGZ74_010142 [Mortierella antarctica]|nr:hypothetical protein BGZ74_010142 [Mortierella antarctica]